MRNHLSTPCKHMNSKYILFQLNYSMSYNSIINKNGDILFNDFYFKLLNFSKNHNFNLKKYSKNMSTKMNSNFDINDSISKNANQVNPNDIEFSSSNIIIENLYTGNQSINLSKLSGLPMKKRNSQTNKEMNNSNSKENSKLASEFKFNQEQEQVFYKLSVKGPVRKKVFDLLSEISWSKLNFNQKIIIINTILEYIRDENLRNTDILLYRFSFRLFQKMFETTYIPHIPWGRREEKYDTITGKHYIPPEFRFIHIQLKGTNRYEPFVSLMLTLLNSYRSISSQNSNTILQSNENNKENKFIAENREVLMKDIFEKSTSIWKSFLHDLVDPKKYGNIIGNAYLEIASRHKRIDIVLDLMERYVNCSFNINNKDLAFIHLTNPITYFSLIKMLSSDDLYFHKINLAFNSLLKDFPKNENLSKIGNIYITSLCKINKKEAKLFLINSINNLVDKTENRIFPLYNNNGFPEISSIEEIFYDAQNIITVIYLLQSEFSEEELKELIIKASYFIPLEQMTDLHNKYMELLLENGKFASMVKYFMKIFDCNSISSVIETNGFAIPNYSSYLNLIKAFSSSQMRKEWKNQGLTWKEMEYKFENLLLYLTEIYPTELKVNGGSITSRKILNYIIQFYSNQIENPSSFHKMLHIFISFFISTYNETTPNNIFIPNAMTYHSLFIGCLMTKNPEFQNQARKLLDVIMNDSVELFSNATQFIQHALKKSIQDDDMGLMYRIINTYYRNPVEGANIYNMTTTDLNLLLSKLYSRALTLLKDESNNFDFDSEHTPFSIFMTLKNTTDSNSETYEILLDWILILKRYSQLKSNHIQIITEIEYLLEFSLFDQSLNLEELNQDKHRIENILHKLLNLYSDINPSHCIHLYQKYFSQSENSNQFYVNPNSNTLSSLLKAYIYQSNYKAFNKTIELYVDSTEDSKDVQILLNDCLNTLINLEHYEIALNIFCKFFNSPIQNNDMHKKIHASQELITIIKSLIYKMKEPNKELISKLEKL